MGTKIVADEFFEWKAFFVPNGVNPNFGPSLQSNLSGGWELAFATWTPGDWEFVAKRLPSTTT